MMAVAPGEGARMLDLRRRKFVALLGGTDLQGAELSNAHLHFANLVSGASLSRARLRQAMLILANGLEKIIPGAKLRGSPAPGAPNLGDRPVAGSLSL